MVVSIASGQLADYLRRIGVPTVIVRKAFTSFGAYVKMCEYIYFAYRYMEPVLRSQ